ncbi:MAG: Hsp20/alpha crystallin family protein [Tepidisphaeraceae bacterium]
MATANGAVAACDRAANDNDEENNMARNDKKKNPDVQSSFGFASGGILEGIQKLVEAAGKLKDSGEISETREFTIPGLGEKGKGIFGFSIKTLAGDASKGVTVRPFGNVRKTKEGLAVEEDREPVVDVLEEGDQIRVIAELPGVSKADITYQVAGDVLTITTKGDRRYHAEVLLPSAAQTEGIESAYNNGVFELKLHKKTQ